MSFLTIVIGTLIQLENVATSGGIKSADRYVARCQAPLIFLRFSTASRHIEQSLITEHRGKTSAHALVLKMAGNLNPTFVNKNMAFKQLRQVKKRKKN